MRAAIRLLSSNDNPAPNNAETVEASKSKHSHAPSDRKPAWDFTGNVIFQPLQVSPEDVIRCLRTFLARSPGGPANRTAQHLRDILAGAQEEQIKTAITDFINVLFNCELSLQGKEIFYGGRLIALQRKDCGIRSLAVGLRRLAAKCVNSCVITKRSKKLQPIQVGAGVSCGAEVTVHTFRSLYRIYQTIMSL